MKQIIQSFKTGETILEEVPVPIVTPGSVLIQTTRSLVSLGTERMLVEFGKSNLISKARQQPEKVKQVLDKIKSDGLLPTLEAVFNKLGQPLPLGYCNVGKVVEVGEGVSEFRIGDRVASNGHHAEYVTVPKNLVVHIPDRVSDEEAAFTVVGAIGLQGIRLLKPTLGETFVIIGLGLIGLITAEILVVNGCNVIGFDFDEDKVKLASDKGVKAFAVSNGLDPIGLVTSLTNSDGADGVIITASSKSNDIISQSAKMCRKRGRIILVGVVGLDINRADFYKKELTFQVSCSYGPGRYDENYEQIGNDYPLPYVRWTEKRNFETILKLIESGKLNVKPLISEKVPLNESQRIYGNIQTTRSIAIILSYPESTKKYTKLQIYTREFTGSTKNFVGIIGSGNFTQMTLLPILKKLKSKIKVISSLDGISCTILAKKYRIPNSTTDYKNILTDPDINLVFIITRHNQHAKLVIEALNAGKHVFVEKPLALSYEELQEIIEVYEKSKQSLTVGFNRRFSPFSHKVKSLIGNEESPLNVVVNVNAGFIPRESWVQDIAVGGGRIIGEACHFIDLISYLTGSYVKSICMSALGTHPKENTDNAVLLLKYANGSQGVINYFSNGNKSYSKERIEIYTQGRTLILDNFRSLKGFGFRGFSKMKSGQDKGHYNQYKELIGRIEKGGSSLIPIDSIINTTKASFAALESLKRGNWVKL